MDVMIASEQATIELNSIRNVHISDPISKNTGCTANVVLITPTHFYVANAGDSRSVLCREGRAVDLSFDHKPESEEEEKRIKNAGGVVYMGRVNGGLNLTRSFGDF
jgi:serine/threonine protein phosphatase PrpC